MSDSNFYIYIHTPSLDAKFIAEHYSRLEPLDIERGLF